MYAILHHPIPIPHSHARKMLAAINNTHVIANRITAEARHAAF